MTRVLLLSFFITSCITTTSLASPSDSVLNPGRDAEQERIRRETPPSPFGLTTLILLSALGGLGCLRAKRAGREGFARGALALTSLTLALGLSELVLYATLDKWAAHVKVRDGCYHDNPRGYFKAMTFRDEPQTLAYCAGPLRDVWERCEEKSADESASDQRILALGDSFTDGVGVFARDAWPAQLERLLGEGHRVVNCGKAASFTSHTAKRYLSHRERHDPELVIYAFVLNDVPLKGAPPPDGRDIAFQAPNRGAHAEGLQATTIVGGLTSHSALARLISERLAQRRIAQETMAYYEAVYAPENQAAFDEAIELVGAMREIAERGGGHFIVALWPLFEDLEAYPFHHIHEKIIEALQKRGIATLDLLATFEGRDASTLQVHPTDHHPNEIAHREAAEAIGQEVKARAWLE